MISKYMQGLTQWPKKKKENMCYANPNILLNRYKCDVIKKNKNPVSSPFGSR